MTRELKSLIEQDRNDDDKKRQQDGRGTHTMATLLANDAAKWRLS
jgi:hypothetical protein